MNISCTDLSYHIDKTKELNNDGIVFVYKDGPKSLKYDRENTIEIPVSEMPIDMTKKENRDRILNRIAHTKSRAEYNSIVSKMQAMEKADRVTEYEDLSR